MVKNEGGKERNRRISQFVSQIFLTNASGSYKRIYGYFYLGGDAMSVSSIPVPALSSLHRTIRELEQEFNRAAEALRLIAELDRKIFYIGEDLDELFGHILKGLLFLTKAEFAQILLRRGTKLVIAKSTQPEDDGHVFAINDCVSGIAVENREIVLSGDVKSDFPKRYRWVLGRRTKQQMMSEVAVPILAYDNANIVTGVLNIESPERDAFHGLQVDMVEQFAIQVGFAIHKARTQSSLALTTRLAESLMQREIDIPIALRNVLIELKNKFSESDEINVQFLLHDSTHSNTLIVTASTLAATEGTRVLIESSFCGMVYERGEPMRSANVREEYSGRFQDTLGDLGGRPTASELAVPIFDDDRVIGVLNLESAEMDYFTEHDEYILSLIARNASVWKRVRQPNKILALEKMATIGDLAGHLVHSLKSELMECGKIASDLEKCCRENRDAHEKAVLLTRSLDAVVESAKDLRLRYDTAKQGPVKIDIESMINAIIRQINSRDDIEVKTEFTGCDQKLAMPPSIHDVIWNLISNAHAAIDEGRDGQILIKVDVTRGRYTGKMEDINIMVKDNGRGIPKEAHEDIWKFGYTSGRGIGYGMWWMRTFIERWEGTVTLESEPGVGTKLFIKLPLPPESVVT